MQNDERTPSLSTAVPDAEVETERPVTPRRRTRRAVRSTAEGESAAVGETAAPPGAVEQPSASTAVALPPAPPPPAAAAEQPPLPAAALPAELPDGAAEGEGERGPGRRRRGRRGRRTDGHEDGPASAEVEERLGGDAVAGLSAPLEAGEPVREASERTPDEEAGPQGRRDGAEGAASSDGRDFRQPAPYGRQDGRGRRDWREPREAVDSRDYRENPRHVPRDRPVQRERGYQSGRDGRQNGAVPRDQARDGQPYRDPSGYREPAGYRDMSYREAPQRDTAYREAPPRERSGYAEPHVPAGGGEPARPARLSEVVTRGYVVAIDPNQNQWQLRTHGHLPSASDATISLPVVRGNGLRVGDEVVGLVRGAPPGRRYGELLDVQSINGVPFERVGERPRFDDLTPIYPDRHMRLERPDSVTAKLIDLVSPVGFGQRALIVSPPKAGKTIILKEIGRSINQNYPDVKLIVCLVGERPEEVTDLTKSLQGEVISSTFDEAIAHHTELAEITIERARRLVESGFDVVVLLDSVTRLARAYNLAAPGDSRSLSGGMATSALYPPKRFFGAARALQEGGSLTVIATCLIDTNSRLDDVIYEELKGTGNMELVLDRRLAEERIFPAVDIVKSSTRREELLLQPNELMAVLRLRRALSMASDPINSTRTIVQQLERMKTNADFLASLLAQTSAR